MEQIQKYILSQVAKQQLTKEEAKVLLTELVDSSISLQRDIAVIGMSGRFPGANDTETFWKLLRSGTNCIREFPRDRLKDIEHVLRNPYYTEFMLGNAIPPAEIHQINVKAGYLDEIDKFDAAFFGIPPSEATYMDPNQRLALEVAWEAMEDAGYGGDALVGSRTAVYIGRDGTNYSFYRLSSDKDAMQLTGSWESMIVSRISYTFDFKGPCMVIDTACSAGMVSVHMAVQALLAGECDFAIAGGLNLTTTGEIKPRYLEGANMSNVESDDGIIRTFDEKANGTVWGEGVALFLLKPLQRAIEDGDNIRAIIKASSINNDGTTNSLTAPSAKTQEDVIVEAWSKSGIPPETITNIEAHGTGTVLGDPIEIKGLTNAFRRYTNKRQFCAIGSLKTNTGHMVAASGAAALVKVIKSIEHKELAPTINFQVPNPYINFTDSPLYVNDMVKPWDVGNIPRRAAISSFGFSRTNCHVVVEEAPKMEAYPARQPRYCLTVSAKSAEAMNEYLRRYDQFLDETSWELADLCYTSNIGRGHYGHRAVIIACNEDELCQKMKILAANDGRPSGLSGVYVGYHTIVNDRKRVLDTGEISIRDHKNMSELTMFKLKEYIQGHSEDATILESVCRYYIEGADIDWQLLYRDELRRRIPIPVYPLQRIRFWANPKITKIRTQRLDALHPLVEQEISTDADTICYETTFCIDRHWVLSDHRISNRAVLPGTTYLEMARFAAARAFGQETLEFSDVFFLVPLVVEEDSEVAVRLTLTPIDSGFSFNVASCNEAGNWVSHVEGRILSLDNRERQANTDIMSLKSRADEVQDPFIGESDTGVFQFGPHWDTVRAVWKIGSEIVARLQLAENLQSELNIFHLHPSILDNAVNLTSQSTGDTFLPFMYKSFKLYAPLTKELYSHIRIHPGKAGKGEIMTYDVDLMDSEGRILAQISQYSVKRVHDINLIGTDKVPGTSLHMGWILRNEAGQSLPENIGTWALIATRGKRCQELQSALENAGLKVHTYYLDTQNNVEFNDTYAPDQTGLDDLLNAIELQRAIGIIFSCDYTAENGEIESTFTSDKAFRNRRSLGVDALFKLCKCILNRKTKWSAGLKVLVRDAYVVDQSELKIFPLSAASAALGRVVGQEYKHLNLDILDVSSTVPAFEVVKELLGFKGVGLRTLRSLGVFVEEIRPYRVTMVDELALEEDGVYLITGGLGGLGLALAKHLADKGRAKVVLLGRRSIASSDEWENLSKDDVSKTSGLYRSLVDLNSRLGSLEYKAINVADNMSVQKLGVDIKERYGKISGIFHAAGVAGDGFLMSKDENRFREVLDPKLNGSMNLMQLLAQSPTGFLALFSSITALTGGEGQGDYSAANAFMDALADAGQQDGIKVVSINWPSWKEVGMSVDFSVNDDANLFSHINVQDGLNWLEYLIMNPVRRLVPADLNTKLAASIIEDLPFSLSKELINTMPTVDNGAGGDKVIGTNVKIKGAVEITDTQLKLGNIFATVLGLGEIDIYASFQDMGGNSLMSTQLLKLIEESFPGIIDITDLFSYPSVYDLSEFIDSKIKDTHKKQTTTENQFVVEDEEIRQLLEDELSGTEFLELFLDKPKKEDNDDG